MDKRKRMLLVAGAAGLVALGGGGIAYANGVGDDERDAVVTGPDADRAGQVAVSSLGGGSVVKVVRESDDGGSFDVEVRKTDGAVVDVHVSSAFAVVPGGDDSGGNDGESDGDNDAGTAPTGTPTTGARSSSPATASPTSSPGASPSTGTPTGTPSTP